MNMNNHHHQAMVLMYYMCFYFEELNSINFFRLCKFKINKFKECRSKRISLTTATSYFTEFLSKIRISIYHAICSWSLKIPYLQQNFIPTAMYEDEEPHIKTFLSWALS